jgi:hypothetical protein
MASQVKATSLRDAEKKLLATLRELQQVVNIDECLDFVNSHMTKLKNDLRSLDRSPHLSKAAKERKKWLTDLLSYKQQYDTFISQGERPRSTLSRRGLAVAMAQASGSVSTASGFADAVPGSPSNPTIVPMVPKSYAAAVHPVAETAAAAPVSDDTCMVCLFPFDLEDRGINFCTETMTTKGPHPCVHNLCFREYLKCAIEDNTNRSKCPEIACFCTDHLDGKNRLLLFNRWKVYASKKQLDMFEDTASYFLKFLCGSCHNMSSQLVKYESYTKGPDIAALLNVSLDIAWSFMTELQKYEEGLLAVKEFHQWIYSFLPSLSVKDNLNAWSYFVSILKCIRSPERRATLQHFYLNDRPHFKTLCCGSEHCFKCKIKGYHSGTCEQMAAKLDSSIMPCPNCGVFLAKGDGCNTVYCACGKRLEWSRELNDYKNFCKFMEDNPGDVVLAASEVLCLVKQGCRDGARVVINKNQREGIPLIPSVFLNAYGPYGYCKLVTSENSFSVFAFEILFSKFKKQVNKKKESDKLCSLSLVESYYQSDHERYYAYKMFCERPAASLNEAETQLSQQLSKWKSNIVNTTKWHELASVYLINNLKQFLFFYGNCDFYTGFYTTKKTSLHVWHTPWCNSNLQFNEADQTMKRPGSVSSFPAAFVKMNCVSGDTFSVEIVECGSAQNYMTFGICELDDDGRPKIPNYGSDGLGRSTYTVGIFDDRENPRGSVVANNGNSVEVWRSFRKGDVLTAEYNGVSRILRLSLNYSEVVTCISLSGSAMYCFAMTIASDHKVRIINNQTDEINETRTYLTKPNLAHRSKFLSANHERMLLDVFRLFRSFVTVTNYNTVFQYVRKFISESAKEADVSLEDWDYIDIASDLVSHRTLKPTDMSLSWSQFVSCLCMDIDVLHTKKSFMNRKLADEFASVHKENSAFVCISILHGSYENITTKDVTHAKAYMEEYSDLCHEWYDYNASLSESLIPELRNVSRSCRCLPRCKRGCAKRS